MEETDSRTSSPTTTETKIDIPKVPIKTYRWEDVKRSRKRGAYPWTHLTKPPFDEDADPEEYTMEAFRRSRSTSTLGKSDRSDTQEISEIEEIEMKEEDEMDENKENASPSPAEEPSTSKDAKEEEPTKMVGLSPSSAAKNGNGDGTRAKSEEPKKKRKLSIESSYSRMSLSKLGLMDKLRSAKNKLKVPRLPKRSKSDASEAKKPVKKQKMTGSVKEKGAWLPTVKDESPVYIHIPLKPPPGETDEFSKLEFESPNHSGPGSMTRLNVIGQGQRKMSLLGLLTELKKVQDHQMLASEARRASQTGGEENIAKKLMKLRPKRKSKSDVQPKAVQEPEGFVQPKTESVQSKTEPGQSKTEPVQSETESVQSKTEPVQSKTEPVQAKIEPVQSKTYLEESIDSVDSVQTKTDLEDSMDSVGSQYPKIELVESMDSATSGQSKLGIGRPRVQRKESDRLVIEELMDDDRRSTKSNKSTKSTEEGRSSKPRTPEPIVVEPEDSSADDNVSQYLDKEDKCEIVSEKSANVSSENVSQQPGPSKVEEPAKQAKPESEKTMKLDAALSAWKKRLPEISPTKTLSSGTEDRPTRAKSEEPKRKRRSSIDSSYSRKSLSKLAFMKRIKEATDKIKLPKFPSFSKADKKEAKKPKIKKSDEVIAKLDKKKEGEKKGPVVPVYIHIPLKPPPGQTDEFSYLATETEPQPPPAPVPEKQEKKEEEEVQSVSTTPDTPTKDVQMIILTPPSDDEILDSSVPETPSETDKKFFENIKIDDLKNLAKKAVDIVCPDSKKLETVTEDEGSEEEKMEEEGEQKEALTPKQQQMLDDEEDGLKLSEAALAMVKQEMEKEAKEQAKSEGSPKLKKKVSFKRKSKTEDGETIYEDVELSNAETKKPSTLEAFQSMSADEEKSYLDKKVIKTTSLEEDYNKWSKSNDHEYEPVNPPPEEMTTRGPPVVRVTDLEAEGLEGNEKHFLRIPADEELVVRDDADENLGAQEVQRRIEDRFFNATPETVSSSRTEGELNTSQVDSSALETLPLKKESRKGAATKTGTPGKSFNETLRSQADKIKTKLQGIKKPNITLPQRPKFPSAKIKKPNFKKPSFTLPKMPDRPSINLPSFSLTRSKDNSKDSWKERQHSTESNAGDSKMKIFDFRTYPRIFDRSKKSKEKEKEREPTPPPPEFATVPRMNRKKGPIGSRWANKFKDFKYADEDARRSKEFDDEEEGRDAAEIPPRPGNEDPMDVPSHTRYNEDIDIEDDFHRESRDIHHASPFSQDYLKRWSHGEFHEQPRPQPDQGEYRITDLDMEEIQTPPEGSFDNGIPPKEEHSSGSLSEHRRGVLEEIDSDEFFLREKGISQENIEVGKYLSSEIREAFRNPVNALSQLQSEDREYDLDVSDQSDQLHEIPKRKPLRKPKRKKTPHVSKEQISFDSFTEPEEYPKRFDEFQEFGAPARPKRKSKKGKKKKPVEPEEVVPYQETIPIEEHFQFRPPTMERVEVVERSEISPDNILSEQPLFYDNGYPQMYENEHMKGIEQPDIKISDPYYSRYENFRGDTDRLLEEKVPVAPTRRHRSLKSLNNSELDSITDEFASKDVPRQDVEAYRAEQEYIIPTPEPAPARPKRTRSRTHSQSGAEDDRTSRGADSLVSDTQGEAVEERICVQDIRDCMGYAVVDKSKARDPPLPPSRFPATPPRARRTKKKSTDKFSTVPRHSSDSPPVRPLRNYSTLGGPSRSRSKSSQSPFDDEKENLDITQYIEIEDEEPVRRLQSGEVIQKMRDRPLPAPPRPPRRPRAPSREVFRDISHERNLPHLEPEKQQGREELETLARTEPSTRLTEIEQQIVPHEETVTHGALIVQPIDNAQILPYSQLHKEFDRSNQQQPRERIVPITLEYRQQPSSKDHDNYDDEETSEVPEEFLKLRNPPAGRESASQRSSQEVGMLTAQKLQVVDLDVDKLRVNELQASKIIVSELDGVSLQVSEINSKSGNLVVSGIELPPNLIQEMLDRLQPSLQAADHSGTPQDSETVTIKPESKSEPAEATEKAARTEGELEDKDEEAEQKKTSTEYPLEIDEEAPPVPPRYDSQPDLLDENVLKGNEEQELTDVLEKQVEDAEGAQEDACEPPTRPPRKSFQPERDSEDQENVFDSEKDFPSAEDPGIETTYHGLQPESSDTMPQADNTSKSEEEPPPRPPQPALQEDPDYVPSQPPASFYALKSPPYGEFAEEDIPLPPRRKRHHKAPPVSRSSSDETPPTQRRHPRSPEPSIPQLTGQLVRACATEADRSLKRLITHITNNVFQNMDGKQDMHVMILMLLILIAGLILLSGDQKITVHHHHWEFFNPPRDL